ncbi:hypothetical protein RQP46_010671 [Phenoliferia psychrophenolica]
MQNDQLAKFKKLDWVRLACLSACHVAFRVGTRTPLHTTHAIMIHYEFDHLQPLARQFRVRPLIHHSLRGPNSIGPKGEGDDDSSVYYDTMSSPGLTDSVEWIETLSPLIDDILPPPSYDWVAALRDKIALGGPAPRDSGWFGIGRVQTERDLREEKRVQERTQFRGGDLKATMKVLRHVRDALGWDGPECVV